MSELERGPGCHPERSEGSGSSDAEILRFAQDDKHYLHMSIFFALGEVSCGFDVSALKNWLLSEECGGLYTRRIFAAH